MKSNARAIALEAVREYYTNNFSEEVRKKTDKIYLLADVATPSKPKVYEIDEKYSLVIDTYEYLFSCEMIEERITIKLLADSQAGRFIIERKKP